VIRPILAFIFLAACGAGKISNLEDQLEAEVIALNQTVKQLKIEAANCSDGSSDTIYSDLTQIFKGTEIGVTRDRGVTLITIPVSHLFADAYSLRFREEAQMSLDLLATALNLHPRHGIIVEGHTNDRLLPTNLVRRFGSHLDLSFQYAAAVMQQLSEDYDVDENRFTVAARGMWDPVASNDITSGQDRNQRVAVHIFRTPDP
jgi:flagellar motor protein MotB